MTIIAIIQARMGSTRLPGKVLQPIVDRPMLGLLIERLQRVNAITEVRVATSTASGDSAIADFCQQQQIHCYRGSENDVLDRYYHAAAGSQNDTIIMRVTADCPLIDPDIIDKLISLFTENHYDHAGIATGTWGDDESGDGRYPDGLDAELIRYPVLAEAWREATDPEHREHVTPFIWQQPKRYKLGQLAADGNWGALRWTVDHPNDFTFVRHIYEALYPSNPDFRFHDILALLRQHPEWLALNHHFVGQEKYRHLWTTQN